MSFLHFLNRILWCGVLGFAGPAWAEVSEVEISGFVSLGAAGTSPLAEVVLSSGGKASVTTDEKGQFRGLKVVVPKDGWIEIEAQQAGYGVVNALDLRRPWPSPLGRSFQIVMAPETEVKDRAVQHWRAQLLQRSQKKPPKESTAGEVAPPRTPLVASYGEWLAAVPKEKPSRAWFQALNLLMTGKPEEAVKALGPVEEPEEQLRRQHLRVIAALAMGDERTAHKQLESAVAGTAPDAWAQLTLGRLQLNTGANAAAQKTLEALANREDTALTFRVEAVVKMAELRLRTGETKAAVSLYEHADALWQEAASAETLSYAEAASWATLKENLVIAALQVEQLPAKAKSQLDPLMERHRALLARLPDVHEKAFVEALEFAASVRIVLKDYAEAETLIRERVAFHTERAKLNPSEHLHQKAQSLESLGGLAMLQKDDAQALACYADGVEIIMSLSQPREAEGHLPLMCGLLRKQGALLLKTGKLAESKTALQQGVSLHQELNRVRPDHVPHMMERALTLQDLGNACMALNESFAAAQAYLAAAQLNNRLVENGVEEHRARAFVCLKNVSAITQKTGHTKESMAHALEALKHAERIEADHPDKHADLAEVSMLAGIWILREEGQAEAKPHMERTVRLYRGLHKEDPTAYAARLGLALCAEAQRVDAEQAGKHLAEAEALLKMSPDDAQAELLRQTLRMTRKERGEVDL